MLGNFLRVRCVVETMCGHERNEKSFKVARHVILDILLHVTIIHETVGVAQLNHLVIRLAAHDIDQSRLVSSQTLYGLSELLGLKLNRLHDQTFECAAKVTARLGHHLLEQVLSVREFEYGGDLLSLRVRAMAQYVNECDLVRAEALHGLVEASGILGSVEWLVWSQYWI